MLPPSASFRSAGGSIPTTPAPSDPTSPAGSPFSPAFSFLEDPRKIAGLEAEEGMGKADPMEQHSASVQQDSDDAERDYYLRSETFRKKLDRQHQNLKQNNNNNNNEEDDEENRTSPLHQHQHLLQQEHFTRSAALQLNLNRPPPAFFYSGRDFPALPSPSSPHPSSSAASTAATTTSSSAGVKHNMEQDNSSGSSGSNMNFFWQMASHSERAGYMDGGDDGSGRVVPATSGEIVLPCVSLHSSMMVAASKGSASLRELHQLQAVERRNKDTMDTSISNLAKLIDMPSPSTASLPLTGAGMSHHLPDSYSAQKGSHYPLNHNNNHHHHNSSNGMKAQAAEHEKQTVFMGNKEENDDDDEKDGVEHAFGGLGFQPNKKKSVSDSSSLVHRDENTAAVKEEEQQQQHVRQRLRVEVALPEPPQANGSSASQSPNSDNLLPNPNNHVIEARENPKRVEVDEEAERQWQEIQEKRRELPIYQCKKALLRMIGENPVTIVVGETGSGKTTQLVQYLYENGYADDDTRDRDKEEASGKDTTSTNTHSHNGHHSVGGAEEGKGSSHRRRGGYLIGCTQPRRLAAVGVARRVSQEMRCPLGSTVGYSIHLDDTTSADTRIKFMTDGVLLREVMQDPDVSAYRVILLDEAHERSMDTDVLMGTLKAAVARRNGELKLIVTSATMDVDKFSRFFHDAPCFYVPGKMYDVKEVFAEEPVNDYVAEAVFRVCQLHLRMPLTGFVSPEEEKARVQQSSEHNNKPENNAAATAPSRKHDILVFMSGKDDVMGTCELIHRRLTTLNPSARRKLLILPCLSEGGTSLTVKALAAPSDAPHSGDDETEASPAPKYVGVLDPTPTGFRKCVVATNVAETSLTIDGVRYVIDAGFVKTNVYRPNMGMNTLQRYPISKAQAGQRKGRAGRTAAGLCFRLYTQQQWECEMLTQSVPEIQRSSMDSVVLLLKSVLGKVELEEAEEEVVANGNKEDRKDHKGLQQQQYRAVEQRRRIAALNRLMGGATATSALQHFDFMDPPPAITIQRSMWTLWIMGFLDEQGEITRLGRRALEFPMSPALAKFVLEGIDHDCVEEVCLIVSMLSADPKNLFEVPKGKEDVAPQQHSRFMVPRSDHLTYLNVLVQYLEHSNREREAREWTKKHFLHYPTLMRAAEVHTQLSERIQRITAAIRREKRRSEPHSHHSDHNNNNNNKSHPSYSSSSSSPTKTEESQQARWERTRRCLAHSFFLQSAQRGGANWSEYRPLLHPGVLCHVHPGSSVCRQVEMPSYVVYNDLLSLSVTQKVTAPQPFSPSSSSSSSKQQTPPTSMAVQKEYLMVVTAVEPEWLAESSQGIFTMKNQGGATLEATLGTAVPSTNAIPMPSMATRTTSTDVNFVRRQGGFGSAVLSNSSSPTTGEAGGVQHNNALSTSSPGLVQGGGSSGRPLGGSSSGGGRGPSAFGGSSGGAMKRRRNI